MLCLLVMSEALVIKFRKFDFLHMDRTVKEVYAAKIDEEKPKRLQPHTQNCRQLKEA